jgi:hypothetical protein
VDSVSLIQDLGRLLGLGAIELADDRRCRLLVEGTLPVDLEVDPRTEALLVALPLGLVPRHGQTAIFGALLEANHLGASTGGGCIGINFHHQEIVLHQWFDPRTTAGPALLRALQRLVAAARRLRPIVLGTLPATQGPAPASSSPEPEPVAPPSNVYVIRV